MRVILIENEEQHVKSAVDAFGGTLLEVASEGGWDKDKHASFVDNNNVIVVARNEDAASELSSNLCAEVACRTITSWDMLLIDLYFPGVNSGAEDDGPYGWRFLLECTRSANIKHAMLVTQVSGHGAHRGGDNYLPVTYHRSCGWRYRKDTPDGIGQRLRQEPSFELDWKRSSHMINGTQVLFVGELWDEPKAWREYLPPELTS